MSTLLARCDLYIDAGNQALICRKCKYVLVTASSQVTTHLDRKHGIAREL
jgi:RNase P subunit RPR2